MEKDNKKAPRGALTQRKPKRLMNGSEDIILINYKKMTMEELADLLNERDINFDLDMRKPELISLLEKSE